MLFNDKNQTSKSAMPLLGTGTNKTPFYFDFVHKLALNRFFFLKCLQELEILCTFALSEPSKPL